MSNEIPLYHPPNVVTKVGALLAIPRESRSTTFSDFFSTDSEAQKDYAKGLIALGTFIFAVAFIWTLTLIVLKLKGREVGCASGHGFDTEPMESSSSPTDDNLRTKESSDTFPDYNEESSDEYKRQYIPRGFENMEYVQREVEAGPLSPDASIGAVLQYPSHHPQEGGGHPMPSTYFGEEDDDEEENPSVVSGMEMEHVSALTLPSEDEYEYTSERTTTTTLHSIPPIQRVQMDELLEFDSSDNIQEEEKSPWSSPERNAVRQRRTRMTYWFFGGMTLICSVLLFGHTYFPFRGASRELSGVLSDGHQVVFRVQRALDIIVNAGNYAEEVIRNDLPMNFREMCPDVPPDQFGESLGTDPRDVVSFVKDEFDGIKSNAEANITSFEGIISEIDSALTDLETSIDGADNTLWLLPLTLASLIILTTVSVLGVLGAQAGLSTSYSQRVQACTVLPTFILLTIICWGYLLGTSFGTVLTYDICTAESPTPPGSPENTIQSILIAQNIHSESAVYQMVTAYTMGCIGENPIQELVDLDGIVSGHVDMIKLRLSQADEIGIGVLRERCGEGNQIDDFFWALRLLDAHLVSVRDALNSAADTLSCPRINELYRRGVHDAICTDVATANASGFVLFLLLTISNMTLITLRSAWRQKNTITNNNNKSDESVASF